jgi:hypothetical protein
MPGATETEFFERVDLMDTKPFDLEQVTRAVKEASRPRPTT